MAAPAVPAKVSEADAMLLFTGVSSFSSVLKITLKGLMAAATDLKEDDTTSGLYYKHIFTIVSDACTLNDSLVFALASASVINYDCK